MSYKKGKKYGYTIFSRVVWFDFELPDYLIGAECITEAIDTKSMFFWYYLN